MSVLLEVQGLVKRFGGLLATDDVSLDLRVGEIHALIGPNGAGKTTLINQLVGELCPDKGRILLDGYDITRIRPHQRVQRGLGRTFQVTNLLNEFSVAENIAIAVQARTGGNHRLFDRMRARSDIWRRADELMAPSALRHRAGVAVEELSQGERKQLELLVALAGEPRLLLLDEPMAGLGHVESREMVEQLREVARTVPLLLVEHDMDAVWALANRVSVMVYGRVIATGSCDEIRNDPRVREAYLGEEDELC